MSLLRAAFKTRYFRNWNSPLLQYLCFDRLPAG